MKLLEIEIEIGISTKETKDSNGKLVTIERLILHPFAAALLNRSLMALPNPVSGSN